ncbi:MAG: hypothetical protein HYT75_01590 [Deltaproteobacteria bacterium]|nr:hypothetical protein [Deltaproteobacteria bacterium]
MTTTAKTADVRQANQSLLDFEPLAAAVSTECADRDGKSRVKTEAKLRGRSQGCQDAVAQAQTNQTKITGEFRTVVEGGLYKTDGAIISRLGEVCPDIEMAPDEAISYADRFAEFHKNASICLQRVSLLFAEDPTKLAELTYVLKDSMGHTWESIDRASKDPDPACNMPAVKSWEKGTAEPADPAPAPVSEPAPAPAPAPMTGTGEKAYMLETVPPFTPAELGDELIAAMEKRWGADAEKDRTAFSESLRGADYEASLSALTVLLVSVNATDMKKFEGAIPEIEPIKVPEFVEVAGPDGRPVPMKDAEGHNIKVDDLLENKDNAEITKALQQARDNTLANIRDYAAYIAPLFDMSAKDIINEWGKVTADDSLAITYKEGELNSGKEMSALLRDFEKFAKAKREKLMKDKPKPHADAPSGLLARIAALPKDEVAWMAQVKHDINMKDGWIDRNAQFLTKWRSQLKNLLDETDPKAFRVKLDEISKGIESEVMQKLGVKHTDSAVGIAKNTANQTGTNILPVPEWNNEIDAYRNVQELTQYFITQATLSTVNRLANTQVTQADIEKLLEKMGYVSENRKKDGKSEPMNVNELKTALGAITDEKSYNQFAVKAKEWAESEMQGPALTGEASASGGAAGGPAPGKGSARKSSVNYGTAAEAGTTKDFGDAGKVTIAIGGSIAGNSGTNIPSVGGITPKKEPKNAGPELSDLNATYTSKDFGDNVTIAGTGTAGIKDGARGLEGGAIVKYKYGDEGEVKTTMKGGYYHQELGNEATLGRTFVKADIEWRPAGKKIVVKPGVIYTFNDPEGGKETEELGYSLGLGYNPEDKGGFGQISYKHKSPFGGDQHRKLLQVSSDDIYLQGGYRFGGFFESLYAFYDISYLRGESELGGTVIGGNRADSGDSAHALGLGAELALSKKFSISPWIGWRTIDIRTGGANEGRWIGDGALSGVDVKYEF